MTETVKIMAAHYQTLADEQYENSRHFRFHFGVTGNDHFRVMFAGAAHMAARYARQAREWMGVE